MRVRTLPQAVKEIRSIDSRSAVNEDMLISLIKDKHLSHSSHGVRTVIEFGNMITTLNDLLEFEDKTNVPYIRSIRGAIMELRETHPELGIGEEHIRRCVADGRISSIKIGCRRYIAMQSFDAPYCEKIMSVQAPSFAKSDMMRRDILEQMSAAISAQVVIPKIKRARANR